MHKKNVVLVTGISFGIGRETAQLLVERGFRVTGKSEIANGFGQRKIPVRIGLSVSINHQSST